MTDGDSAHSDSDGESVDNREDEREKSSSHKAAVSHGQSDLSGSQKQVANSENSENEEKVPNEESGDEEEHEKAGSEAQSYWDEEDDLQALLDEVKQRQDDRQQKRGATLLKSYQLFSWL